MFYEFQLIFQIHYLVIEDYLMVKLLNKETLFCTKFQQIENITPQSPYLTSNRTISVPNHTSTVLDFTVPNSYCTRPYLYST